MRCGNNSRYKAKMRQNGSFIFLMTCPNLSPSSNGWVGAWDSALLSPTNDSRSEAMFKKRHSTNPRATGSDIDPVQRLLSSQPFDRSSLRAKRQRVADAAKILLDVAKDSSDWFPPLKLALVGVNALIKHYEVLAELVAVAHN